MSALLAVAVLFSVAQITPTFAKSNGVIVVRGNKMYNANTGERFMMKGMTYEYAVSDEYYTKYSKAVIAENLKGLEFNTVRIYNINPEESYKLFMNDMEALGVYVLVAASPDNDEYFGKYRFAPIRKDLGPESTSGETCYPALLLEYGKKIAANFAQYDNTLGIILANEIMQIDLKPAACLKQYAADLKNWMRANGKMMRILPLAYAAADSSYDNPKLTDTVLEADEYNVLKMQGLICGDTMKDGMMLKSIDIFLINEYRWCPGNSYEEAYQRFLELTKGFPIVVAFGEYGCHQPEKTTRKWEMVPYLYQEPSLTKGFSNVFSGGLAYSYGEAKLDKSSGFPMFSGGSISPLEKPSYIPKVDYTNLKNQFAKYEPYKEKAGWTDSTKCSWAPKVTESISANNKRATKSGWIIDSCTSSELKMIKSDTWVAKTREGAECDATGARCDVKLSKRVGTTQEDICGGTYVVESGGGKCTTSTDCGTNGQCLKVNGVNECSCLACWSGSDCRVRDTVSCSKLSSSKTAPKIIFGLVGAFLGVMLVVFIALAFIAQKKKRAMDRLGDQVKLRAPGAAPAQAPAAL